MVSFLSANNPQTTLHLARPLLSITRQFTQDSQDVLSLYPLCCSPILRVTCEIVRSDKTEIYGDIQLMNEGINAEILQTKLEDDINIGSELSFDLVAFLARSDNAPLSSNKAKPLVF